MEEAMKVLQVLLLMCLSCTITINAQTGSGSGGIEMTVGEDSLHAQLQLTTSVGAQRYCSNGKLLFTLRLNFTNVGKESIVLDKRSSVIPKYTVSRSAKAAAEKKYEMKVHRLIGLDSAGLSYDSILDESHFVTLKSGESYSLNEGFSLPVYHGTDNKEDSLRAGNYVLQIAVSTWYYPRVSNVKGREQWRQKGYLWSDAVTSLPMSFKVEKNRSVVECP